MNPVARRGVAATLHHLSIPTEGADAVMVRGFVHDVDTGVREEEVSYPSAGRKRRR